jgi:hypothetical protein
MGTRIRKVVPLIAVALLGVGCGSSDSSDGTTSANAPLTCDGYESGWYKCDFTGSYGYNLCSGGSWLAGACTCTVSVGDPRKPPYASTCKGDGLGNIECSYAGSRCRTCTKGVGCN